MKKAYLSKSLPIRSLQFLFYLMMGSISPFIGLYLKKIIAEPYGLKGTAFVGILFFIQPLVTLPSVPILGYLSDKHKIAHRLTSISSFLLVLAALFFYIPVLFTMHFSLIALFLIIAMSVFGIFSGLLMPLIDSETLHYLHNKDGTGTQYGKIRMWGSAGWIVSPILVGFFAFTYANLSFSILFFALSALVMGLFSLNGSTFNESKEKIQWSILKTDHPFIFFLLFIFILNIAITSAFAFTSWFMDDGNTGLLVIGLAFGLSALPELPLMVYVDKISAKLGNRKMISLGILIEGIRLLLFLIVARSGRTEFYILLLSLHGIFWTLFYNGLIQFIDNRPGENMKATRLSLVTLVSAGGAALGGPFGAWIISRWNSFQLMKVDGVIMIIMAFIFLSSKAVTKINE